MAKYKKALRKRGAVNKAVGLIRSGVAKIPIDKDKNPVLTGYSVPVLEGVLAQERKNTPLARAASDALAAKHPKQKKINFLK